MSELQTPAMVTSPLERLVGPVIVALGLGTNSVAELCLMKEKGIRPDYIVFADTGGEKPHTYDYLNPLSEWLKRVDFPAVTIIKGRQPQQKKDGTLERECLRLKTLPPKAFGFGTCSEKWKIAPFNRWAKDEGLMELNPVKLIGFDFDEPDRADKAQKEKGWIKRFPLIEWFCTRADCKNAIKRAGLPQPGKSACFFCPSTKKHELIAMYNNYPDLVGRAIEIERNSREKVTTVKGLGRTFSWERVIWNYTHQMTLACFVDPPPQDCGCYD